ncbi:hypothetical protein [Vibrio fluvialis]|uniref:hypothetical protein n=1 Tax=Vibrio fluvialis TaxID=676 RepID=UPI00192A8842|nr:hypothetical protein [Vibrio fluvialis]MBL4240462.1 hypothetical protein [Vibrio fluvialis]MBL4265515.1 hypothetical protein [Vibrio fluvialis]MBL4271754.1 hypothetical protein [Vibrio fluvialis]MBL4276099.1 hypothetical protein [Vibrio fluvialis]MBO1442056.1 hypothetical protein [Vibrio fluvialis]
MVESCAMLIRFLSGLKNLSPEGRYLLLAVLFAQMEEEYGQARRTTDMSVARLRSDFGVSHKVVREVIGYLELNNICEIERDRHGKRSCIFRDRYISKLQGNEPEYIRVALYGLFSRDAKDDREKLEKSLKTKLRPSNLLLMAIFVLHSDEFGLVQQNTLHEDRASLLLSESKLRYLMGNISESRLKTQIETLRSIGFIRKEVRGGVSSIYFGKFSKRYLIDLGLINKSLVLVPRVDGAVLKNVSTLTYEVPDQYLTYKRMKECSLCYEFDFELPFKLSFFVLKKISLDQFVKEKFKDSERGMYCIDGFDLTKLDGVPFVRGDYLTFAILTKVEILTAFILSNYWGNLIQDSTPLFSNIEHDERLQSVLSEKAIFTQKFLCGHEDLNALDVTWRFWQKFLLNLSISLAKSLAKMIQLRDDFTHLKSASVLLYGFEHYNVEKGGYPSCNIWLSFSVGEKHYEIDIVSQKVTPSEAFIRRNVQYINHDDKANLNYTYTVQESWLDGF